MRSERTTEKKTKGILKHDVRLKTSERRGTSEQCTTMYIRRELRHTKVIPQGG